VCDAVPWACSDWLNAQPEEAPIAHRPSPQPGAPHGHALIGSIASLSNVGPSLGSIGSMGNYNLEPSALKFVFTADMFMGRVEIYPIFAVLSMIFNRK